MANGKISAAFDSTLLIKFRSKQFMAVWNDISPTNQFIHRHKEKNYRRLSRLKRNNNKNQ